MNIFGRTSHRSRDARRKKIWAYRKRARCLEAIIITSGVLVASKMTGVGVVAKENNCLNATLTGEDKRRDSLEDRLRMNKRRGKRRQARGVYTSSGEAPALPSCAAGKSKAPSLSHTLLPCHRHIDH